MAHYTERGVVAYPAPDLRLAEAHAGAGLAPGHNTPHALYDDTPYPVSQHSAPPWGYYDQSTPGSRPRPSVQPPGGLAVGGNHRLRQGVACPPPRPPAQPSPVDERAAKLRALEQRLSEKRLLFSLEVVPAGLLTSPLPLSAASQRRSSGRLAGVPPLPPPFPSKPHPLHPSPAPSRLSRSPSISSSAAPWPPRRALPRPKRARPRRSRPPSARLDPRLSSPPSQPAGRRGRSSGRARRRRTRWGGRHTSVGLKGRRRCRRAGMGKGRGRTPERGSRVRRGSRSCRAINRSRRRCHSCRSYTRRRRLPTSPRRRRNGPPIPANHTTQRPRHRSKRTTRLGPTRRARQRPTTWTTHSQAKPPPVTPSLPPPPPNPRRSTPPRLPTPRPFRATRPTGSARPINPPSRPPRPRPTSSPRDLPRSRPRPRRRCRRRSAPRHERPGREGRTPRRRRAETRQSTNHHGSMPRRRCMGGAGRTQVVGTGRL